MSNKITKDELHPSLLALIAQGGNGTGSGSAGTVIASPTPPEIRSGLWIDTSK